jgi:hypothetical protein
METKKLYISGEYVDSKSGKEFSVINPGIKYKNKK